MSLEAQIIDQQTIGVHARLKERLASHPGVGNSEEKQKSVAFLILAVKTALQVTEDEAFDCITEGSNDFGVDAIHISAVQNGEFTATLFQSKYSRDLNGQGLFPQTGVEKLIQAVGALFDPGRQLTLNPVLKAKIEDVRSLIRDGYIPRVRTVTCNNGQCWNAETKQLIDQQPFGSQVSFDHLGLRELIAILQATQPVNDQLTLAGKAIVEEFDFRRVLVGRVPVSEIAALFDRHGDKLLERNIRRYLGLNGNRVNQGIFSTLETAAQQPNFYFYNNGVTMVCTRFRHNAMQQENWSIRLDGLQVINGGQTCRTIQNAISQRGIVAPNATVLLRIYELGDGDQNLIPQITYATNSQNPVDLRDLRSNDPLQVSLAQSIAELGFNYRRQRSEDSGAAADISSAIAAEAVLAIIREQPHQAKFYRQKHFEEPLYSVIFGHGLNGAQLVTASLIFRYVEARRRRATNTDPEFIPYASHYIALLMGRALFRDLALDLRRMTHADFLRARGQFDDKASEYYDRAVELIRSALTSRGEQASNRLQWLSAQFRRADLLEWIRLLEELGFA